MNSALGFFRSNLIHQKPGSFAEPGFFFAGGARYFCRAPETQKKRTFWLYCRWIGVHRWRIIALVGAEDDENVEKNHQQ